MSKIASHEPFGHLQHKLWQKERPRVKLVIWFPTRGSATHRWKALKENYKFALNLIPIGGLSKQLWICKIPGVQIGTVSRLPLGSPGTKSHLDVGAAERHREYYMGEGGGFPRIRAVVSLMNLGLPMACSSTKGAAECELINLLVGLMQVWISN